MFDGLNEYAEWEMSNLNLDRKLLLNACNADTDILNNNNNRITFISNNNTCQMNNNDPISNEKKIGEKIVWGNVNKYYYNTK